MAELKGKQGEREREREDDLRPHRSLLCISITQRHEYQSGAADLKLRGSGGGREAAEGGLIGVSEVMMRPQRTGE